MMPYKKYIFRISPANMGMLFPKTPEFPTLPSSPICLKNKYHPAVTKKQNREQKFIYFFH
jgi:hypothetical protein